MSKSIKNRWNKAADAWDDFVSSGKDYYKEKILLPTTLALLPKNSRNNKKALDLCCGEGYYSRILKHKGYEVVGVDISEKLVEIAKSKDNTIPYYCCDASNLDIFSNNNFDLVICAMALQDSPNYKKIINEVYRILKFKGHFIFSISHPCFSFEKLGGWERDDFGNKLYFKMDNYFIEDKKEVRWNMPRLKYQFTTMTHHRTISTYFNYLIKAGFFIDNITEPFFKGDDQNNIYKESIRIGYFLFLKCRK